MSTHNMFSEIRKISGFFLGGGVEKITLSKALTIL